MYLKTVQHIEQTTFHSIVFHLTTVTSIAMSIGNSEKFLYMSYTPLLKNPAINALISHRIEFFSGNFGPDSTYSNKEANSFHKCAECFMPSSHCTNRRQQTDFVGFCRIIVSTLLASVRACFRRLNMLNRHSCRVVESLRSDVLQYGIRCRLSAQRELAFKTHWTLEPAVER